MMEFENLNKSLCEELFGGSEEPHKPRRAGVKNRRNQRDQDEGSPGRTKVQSEGQSKIRFCLPRCNWSYRICPPPCLHGRGGNPGHRSYGGGRRYRGGSLELSKGGAVIRYEGGPDEEATQRH